MTPKVLLFAASEKGYIALTRVLTGPYRSNVGCVITFEEVNVDKSWDIDIRASCDSEKIPCFLWKNVKDNIAGIIKEYHIAGALALSWKYLLPLEINRYLEYPLIIFHDSLLPKYRGFAPTPTAIMCGETEVGVSAIFASEQVDQGDIVLQTHLRVAEDMYIADIIKAEAAIYGDILEAIIEKMERGKLTGYPQIEEEASYSIWRNADDCHIDWKKSAKEIYNFIRAVGSPYPGAFCYVEQKKIKISRAEVLPKEMFFPIREPGKIWSIKSNQPEVVCGSGLLRILSAVDELNQQFLFKKVRCRLE